jgi:hypothetical protein
LVGGLLPSLLFLCTCFSAFLLFIFFLFISCLLWLAFYLSTWLLFISFLFAFLTPPLFLYLAPPLKGLYVRVCAFVRVNIFLNYDLLLSSDLIISLCHFSSITSSSFPNGASLRGHPPLLRPIFLLSHSSFLHFLLFPIFSFLCFVGSL